MEEQRIGQVTHYFSRLRVAGIELSDVLEAGDVVRIRGATTDFCQRVTSIEIDRRQVSHADTGNLIGLMVLQRVRPGDQVYKVVGPDRFKVLEELDSKEVELG
jgi:hypothetical protein